MSPPAGLHTAQMEKIYEGIDTIQRTLQDLIIEYRTQHQRVVDRAQSAHERIDKLESDVAKMASLISQLKELMAPVLFANKIIVWVATVLGASVILLVWSMITGQVQLVFP